ncbi:unnamed protein product, partial [Brenthis ino]
MIYLLLVKTFLIFNIFSNRIVVTIEIKGHLSDPLTLYNIFKQYVKPALTFSSIENTGLQTKRNLDIDRVIRAKIVELQERLQDYDVKALNNVLLEGKDDTTIIEFLPKMGATRSGNLTHKDYKLRNNLKKYKKLREKIDKALLKESVSHKTKQLVSKTLDDMIRKMLGNQCQWKTNVRTEKTREPHSIADRWNKGVHKIKNLLLKFFSKNKNARRDDISSAMDSIQVLLNSVADDIDIISKRYKIQCEFIPKHTNALRNKWDGADIEEGKCADLVICSGELNEFMHRFYRALNDTATNVIRNYIEMYMRDVASDRNEKRKIIKQLKKLADNLEVKVQEIFVTETQKLRLDENKRTEENLNHLSHYVRHSIRNVKSLANDVIKTKLYKSTDKVTAVIIDDIKVNMDIDLGNLEREFVTKICSMFHICNGKNMARRRNFENNKNNLYVQVEVSFDDDMVDLNSLRRVNQNGGNNTFNITYYLNVTRTTNMDNVSTMSY